jgi:branched-chain amino acid transport system permease protein
MDTDIALILTVDGVTSGAIYVLIALGIVLIYSVTRVIFVPFGDIAAFTALTLAQIQSSRLPGTVYIVAVLAILAFLTDAYGLATLGRLSRIGPAAFLYLLLPALPIGLSWITAGRDLPMAAQMALALALVLPIAPLIDRIAFRPMARASTLVLLIIAVAVHFALAGLALISFGPEGFRTAPLSDARYDILGATVSLQTILVVLAAVLFSGLLYLFFDRTLAGKSLKATASNRLGARLVGIRPARAGSLAFLIASALGGISGLLIGPITTLYYDSGFIIGLKAFVGAIIGGLVSYPLTAAGALTVGLLESFASFYDSALKETIVFAALIPILIWRSLASGSSYEDDDEEIEA